MRSIVLAVLGSFLAVGGVQAAPATCPPERCIYKMVPDDTHYMSIEIANPAMTGEIFQVTRYARDIKDVTKDGSTHTIGYEAMTLEGKAGSFVVYLMRYQGAPSFETSSWDAKESTYRKLEWGVVKASPAGVGGGFFVVESGPLTGLVPEIFGCQPKGK